MARYGQAYKDRLVARLLPPESAAIFGPFRHLLASPIYHRWHHTSATRGGSSNFTGTFPLIDLVLSTFYMPTGQRPDAYGVDDPHFPTDFVGQLRHPFLHRRLQSWELPELELSIQTNKSSTSVASNEQDVQSGPVSKFSTSAHAQLPYENDAACYLVLLTGR